MPEEENQKKVKKRKTKEKEKKEEDGGRWLAEDRETAYMYMVLDHSTLLPLSFDTPVAVNPEALGYIY